MGAYYKIANMTRREFIDDVAHCKKGQYESPFNPPYRTMRRLIREGQWHSDDDIVVVCDGGDYTAVDGAKSIIMNRLVEEVGIERGYDTPDYEFVRDTFTPIKAEI